MKYNFNKSHTHTFLDSKTTKYFIIYFYILFLNRIFPLYTIKYIIYICLFVCMHIYKKHMFSRKFKFNFHLYYLIYNKFSRIYSKFYMNVWINSKCYIRFICERKILILNCRTASCPDINVLIVLWCHDVT